MTRRAPGQAGRAAVPAAGAARFPWLDRRPIIIAIAGPNGAGKTTFYHAHVEPAGLRFVNADVVSQGLTIGPYEAARLAAEVREALVASGESFVFETVFSDPVGDKLAFLEQAAAAGYAVVLCFIGIANAGVSDTRVAMRVSQGGHDVPADKLVSRFPRTMANLRRAVARLPHVLIFDNDDLRRPFRLVAVCEHGTVTRTEGPLPDWCAIERGG